MLTLPRHPLGAAFAILIADRGAGYREALNMKSFFNLSFFIHSLFKYLLKLKFISTPIAQTKKTRTYFFNLLTPLFGFNQLLFLLEAYSVFQFHKQ